MLDPAIFAAIFVILYVAHGIGDYWVQTDWQAQNKAKNKAALLLHVSTYTLTFAPALLAIATFRSLNVGEFLVALLAIAVPHALLDTRKLITWFCEKTKGWRRDNQVNLYRDEQDYRQKSDTRIIYSAQLDRISPVREPGPSPTLYTDDTRVYYCSVPYEGEGGEPVFKWVPFAPPIHATRDLNPWEIAIRLHVTIALDQKAHYLCLAAVAAWLAWR